MGKIGGISIIMILILTLYKINNTKYINKESESQYECGIESKEVKLESRKFNLNYYILGLIFLIFDIEAFFLFPFIESNNNYNYLDFSYYLYILIYFLIFFSLIFEIYLTNFFFISKSIHLYSQSLINP